MKTHYLFCVVFISFGWLNIVHQTYGSSNNDSSRHSVDPGHLSASNYLVIGVFAYQDNAESFSQYAQTQGVSAQYGYHPLRGYYYVYTFTSDSVARVVDQCLRLRDMSEFADAWVFEANVTDKSDGWADVGQDNPETNTLIGAIESIETVDHQVLNADELAPVIAELPQKQLEPGHHVYFQTIDEDNQPVTAVIKVVDGLRAKSIKQCQAYQPEVLEYSRLLSDQVQLITYAVGYRKTTFDLPLDEPVNDSTASYVTLSYDTIKVTMPLEKLRKGDVQAMYNTYFYGNASVMRDRSRYELEELQQFLAENPTIRIVLHGHTNGNSRGIVYQYLDQHDNFFNLRRGSEYKKNGVSSMKLSKLRAETIRQYLIKKGIAEDRIETKGWGGKKMLYDADSPLAKNNIRVEIEVLEE